MGASAVPQGGPDPAAAGGEMPSRMRHNAGGDSGAIPGTTSTPAGHPSSSTRKSEEQNRRYDAFISYSHKDGAGVAVLLDEGLANRGLNVWRDESQLSISGLMYDEIKAGLDGSRYAIVVITPAYYDGRHTLMEIGRIVLGDYRGSI